MAQSTTPAALTIWAPYPSGYLPRVLRGRRPDQLRDHSSTDGQFAVAAGLSLYPPLDLVAIAPRFCALSCLVVARRWSEPDSPQHFEVLFDDPHLLAVSKPGGLPTLPGGGFMENTLLRLVQKRTPNANPVHRLGRATTGIVLFTKTPQAAAELSANWNTPRIQKIYRALAQGIAQNDAYEILTPIGLVPHPRIGSVWAANPSGKPSKSLARVISRTASTTTFEVSLHSGRPHQIRIHLASIGHPLVGDPLYGLTGLPLESLPGLPGDGGYFLHAQFLKFHHPITGEQIDLEAALPPGFSLPQ